MRRGDAYAGVLIRLPETEDGPGGILHNSHAARIENVEGRSQDGAAKLGGAGGSSVGALNRDVELPVGRNALGELFGTKRTACGGVTSLETENRIEVVGPHGHVVGGPAKDFGVEVDGSVLVGGGEFGPAKCARSVFFNVWHSAGSVLPGRHGGKRSWVEVQPSLGGLGDMGPVAQSGVCATGRFC